MARTIIDPSLLDLSGTVDKTGDEMTGTLQFSDANPASILVKGTASSDPALASRRSSKSQAEFRLEVGGKMVWSDGDNSPDVLIERSGADTLRIGDGDTLQQNEPPQGDDDLTNKKYVDDEISGITGFVVDTGDTMTGALEIDTNNTGSGVPALSMTRTITGNKTFGIDSFGDIHWADPATGAVDVVLERTAASTLRLALGDSLQVQQDPGGANDLTRRSYVDAKMAAAATATLPDYSANGVGGLSVAATTMPYNSEIDTVNGTLNDNQIQGFALWVPETTTINNVHFLVGTNGNFTADNNNKIGIYVATAATQLSLQASTADDGNLFQQGTGWQSGALSAPYEVQQGWVWVVFMRNSSAQVIAPALKRVSSSWISAAAPPGASSPFFADRKYLSFFQNGTNDLPGGINLTTVGGSLGTMNIIALE